jgi:purine nucleosidase
MLRFRLNSPSKVQDHYEEARRVMQLCEALKIPLKLGAQEGFKEIALQLDQPDFDGHEAVDLIIEQARSSETAS